MAKNVQKIEKSEKKVFGVKIDSDCFKTYSKNSRNIFAVVIFFGDVVIVFAKNGDGYVAATWVRQHI